MQLETVTDLEAIYFHSRHVKKILSTGDKILAAAGGIIIPINSTPLEETIDQEGFESLITPFETKRYIELQQNILNNNLNKSYNPNYIQISIQTQMLLKQEQPEKNELRTYLSIVAGTTKKPFETKQKEWQEKVEVEKVIDNIIKESLRQGYEPSFLLTNFEFHGWFEAQEHDFNPQLFSIYNPVNELRKRYFLNKKK